MHSHYVFTHQLHIFEFTSYATESEAGKAMANQGSIGLVALI